MSRFLVRAELKEADEQLICKMIELNSRYKTCEWSEEDVNALFSMASDCSLTEFNLLLSSAVGGFRGDKPVLAQASKGQPFRILPANQAQELGLRDYWSEVKKDNVGPYIDDCAAFVNAADAFVAKIA